jgi:hypothetical protein
MPRPRRAPEPPIFTFRVRLPGQAVSRDIEVAANQTLVDLGDAIPAAFAFTDPHLWSFFLSGKAWDPTTEYARQGGAARLRIDAVPFPGVRGAREFLFLFDYGDEWHFGVKLVRIHDAVTPDAAYPRVVARAGAAPPQYPDLVEARDDTDADPGDGAA